MTGATPLSPDDPRLAELAAQWRSAYIHIPFCASVCPYCDFAVVAGQDELTDRYVTALISEIEMHPDWETLDAVFLGGGTPSRLSPALLQKVIDALRNKFGLSSDAEVSMEVNPEDWDAAYAEDIAAGGITRASFGAQSFDDDILERLGRNHRAHHITSAVEAARQQGLSVSLDLMFGEPSESIESWARSVGSALDLGVAHLSMYALTVEKGTELSRLVLDGAEAPDEDDQADKYELAFEAVQAAGLVRYEVSNAASPGHVCRYNMSVWAQGDYVSFGLGAHGHIGGVRRRNVRRLDRYLTEVEADRRPTAGEGRIKEWAAELERLMLGLRRAAGVHIGVGGRTFVEASESAPFFEREIIEIQDGRLVVLQPLLTDSVIREILGLVDAGQIESGDC